MAELSDKISFPGQIDIEVASIITSSGNRADITAIIQDITIYEDIFSNTLTGYVLVEDTTDLINNLPLIGQEQLELRLVTPTLNKKFDKIFYIYKLQQRISKKRSQMYMLNFCSKELIYSENSKVSKAFSGNITDTVESIFSDPAYFAESTERTGIYTEKTKNSYSFIAPYWTPFATINWLADKSINANGTPNFLFFETNQSFEFTSIEKLMEAGEEREYIYSDIDPTTALGVNGDKDEKYKIILSMDTPVTFDYLRSLKAGMFSSKLYTMDMTTRTINSNSYDYIKDFNKTKHLNDFGNSGKSYPLKTNNLLKKRLASLYFIEKNNYLNGSLQPKEYSKFFLQRNSLVEQLSAFKICIKVHGRTDIKAGNVIKFTINEFRKLMADEIGTEATSDYLSGRYLVTAIRHQIISGRHTMYMEIISDSFIKSLTPQIS